MKKYIISILAVVLFCSGYWICELFYPDDLTKWWRLRMTLTTINWVLIFNIFYNKILTKNR